jgi:2-(3-amino-3-carboxypropyl)histidine synthase
MKYSTNYDLELEKIVEEVKKNNHKQILLQFPDGLKMYAKEVVDYLKKHTNAEYYIYMGSCFGACDLPIHLEKLGFTLCIQWGHSEFVKEEKW